MFSNVLLDRINQGYLLRHKNCKDIDLTVDSFTKLFQLAPSESAPILGNYFFNFI